MLNSFVTLFCDVVMQPTNGTQHLTSLWVSWQRSPLDSRGMSCIYLMGKKNSTKKWAKQAKGEEQRPQTSFCDMCHKFPSFVRWKTRCKQNVQIEIPDESPRKTSTFCWRPLRLWYPFYLLLVPLNIPWAVSCAAFNIFKLFFL